MPGFIVHLGANVTCSHFGQATPSETNPRVLVDSQPVVPITSPWLIAGCTLPTPPAANGPCVSAQFLTPSTRVFSEGQPLLLIDSQSICAPTGTPALILVTQTRVIAT